MAIGISTPLEGTLNSTIGALSNPLLNIVGLPGPVSTNVSGLLTQAASGSNIGLNVIASDGTLVGPGSTCNAQADSYTLDTPAGVSIGGNAVTGLGSPGDQASAGEIDSVAIGNRATTNAAALGSIAIGTDAVVGPNGTGSVALGTGSSATGSNSVALGAGSVASRGPQPGSAGEVSIGAPGAERQLTNVAAGTAPTDAVNIQQFQALAALVPTDAVEYDDPTHSAITLTGAGGTRITNVAVGAVSGTSTDAINGSQLFALSQQVAGLTAVTGNSVQYDDPTQGVVTLGGAAGTTLTNVAAGALTATSNDAVNGSQLFATNNQVQANTAAITSLGTQVTTNTNDIATLQLQIGSLVTSGGSPVQYSDASAPTVPNGGAPSNDVTIVGGAPGPVAVHNVAPGLVAAGSTDAVNGGQLAATNEAVANAQATADQAQATADDALGLASNSVQYDNTQRSSATLNPGGTAARLGNVATGTAATDAVNVAQLQAVASGAVTNAINTAVSQSNAYTDSRISALSFDLRSARREARAGSAAALAAAALPQPIEGGRTMIAGGVGTYGGRSALAIGASHASEDGRSVFRVGVTYDSNERVGANAGFGIQF